MPPMKYWEIIPDKLRAAGWSWAIAAPLPETTVDGSLTPIGTMIGVTLSNPMNC